MVSPRKNLDISKFLLTDEFSEEGLIKIKSDEKVNDKSSKSKNVKKLKKKEIENISKNLKFKDLENTDYSLNEKKNKDKSNDSNVEFIIVEDDENEKKLIINLQLKLKESLEGTELIKIDFEIGKEIYLDLIKELLK